MSRQLEERRELRQQKRDRAVIKALEYELSDALGHAGADLRGFTVKLGSGDCLVVLKVVLAGKRQISFVGAETVIDAILKAVREARSDRLVFRADKYTAK